MPIFTIVNTLIDVRVPYLIKIRGSVYEFMEHFASPSLWILTSKNIPRVNPSTNDELEASIGDCYLMKDKIVIMRYGFFDALFLFPKHPPQILLALDMKR